jgi:hypothetical protein
MLPSPRRDGTENEGERGRIASDKSYLYEDTYAGDGHVDATGALFVAITIAVICAFFGGLFARMAYAHYVVTEGVEELMRELSEEVATRLYHRAYQVNYDSALCESATMLGGFAAGGIAFTLIMVFVKLREKDEMRQRIRRTMGISDRHVAARKGDVRAGEEQSQPSDDVAIEWLDDGTN